MPGIVLGAEGTDMKKTESLPSKTFGLVRRCLQAWATIIQCSEYDGRGKHRVLRKHRQGLREGLRASRNSYGSGINQALMRRGLKAE